jgi:hypothetical protein
VLTDLVVKLIAGERLTSMQAHDNPKRRLTSRADARPEVWCVPGQDGSLAGATAARLSGMTTEPPADEETLAERSALPSSIFCPRCGGVMEERDGTLTCSTFGSALSSHAQAALKAIVISGPQADESNRDQPIRWGVAWFCPADGQPLREVRGALLCDVCRRILPGRLVYELTDFNPHDG